MFKIYDEPESPNEGPRFKITLKDESESPSDGAWLRYMRSRNRQMRGRVEEIYASKKTKKKAHTHTHKTHQCFPEQGQLELLKHGVTILTRDQKDLYPEF